MQDSLHAARVLMGDSLGFHIIFVLLGLTLPVLVSWFELKALRTKENRFLEVAHFWSKIMGLLVVTGVISGVIIALQMSLVWPGILKFGGQVIGLPFMFETYAFLIEATFLALYLTTWKKVSPLVHWLFSLMVIIGSTMSAYAIISVNAWMNKPAGFDYLNGQIVHVHVFSAMFSRTSVVEFVHSLPAFYVAASLLIAGFYFLRLARGSDAMRKITIKNLDWSVAKTLMLFAGFMLVVTVFTADVTGKYLAKNEPVKLAAIEANYTDSSHVPLIIGGVAHNDGTITGPRVQIPNALSVLAGGSSSTVVTGYASTPVDLRPPLVVHVLFAIKMIFVGLLVLLVFGFFALYYFARSWLKKRAVLLGLSLAGIVGVTVVELGWMLTELGRQPWAVRDYVTTNQAFTTSAGVTTFGYLFPLAFLGLFIVTGLGLRKLIKDEQSRKGGTLV